MQPEIISDSDSGLVAFARALAIRYHLPRTLVKFLVVGGAAFLIYQFALFVFYDTPLAWFWRHERAARIYDGPDEVHKLALARQLLRPYRAG